MEIASTPAPRPAAPAAAPQPRDDPLWRRAVELEALLFAQMLDAADAGGASLDGSDGPAARFDSLLRRAQAEAVAGSGATGLARMIYRSLAPP